MIKVQSIADKKIWEQFVLSSDNPSFLQSWNWGQFHQINGAKIFRLGFYQNNQLKGVALLIKIKAKRGTYLECPGGPVFNFNNPPLLKSFIDYVKPLALKENASFVRIRPNIIENQSLLKKLHQLGLTQAPMHLHAETTWVLNLDQSQDALLQNMRKNTRYSIKKAIKLGVKVEKSIKTQDVELLYNLQLETVRRKKFVPFSQQYFQNQLDSLKNDNQIQLFKATYKGQVLAVSFIIFYGHEAVYHYSGSSSKLRHIPASYLLQWEAIKEAKSRGLKQYNFWGIAKTDDPKHRFAGVSLFKKGFGGFRVDYLRTHDLPVKKSYRLIHLFETLRKKSRHL